MFNFFNKKQEKNKKKIINNIVDNNEKKQIEILKQIVEKSDKFFINNLFNTLPDIYYGSDAAEMFLTVAEVAGKRLGLTEQKLTNFVRDEIISQGYIFHRFDNKYIKENKMIDVTSKYIKYILLDLVNFRNCFINETEIVKFNIIRLSEAIIWAGISGTDIRGLFESSIIPPTFKSIIIYFNNLSISISLELFNKNQDLIKFSSNTEENRAKLREMILRNIESFVEEYKTKSNDIPNINKAEEIIKEEENKNLNNYQMKAKEMSQVLFRLVDQYITSWIEDKVNAKYIAKYNTVFVRLQMHIETLFYMLFFIDRFVFTKLGADKRSIFMDELIKGVKIEMGIVYKNMLDETEIKVDEIFSSYNYAIQTYSNARMEFMKKKEGIDDLWIYGKIISKMLVDNDTDFILISKSFSRFAAFMKYMFWDEIKLVFEDVN